MINTFLRLGSLGVGLSLLGACVEHKDPVATGTQSLKIDLVTPASGGSQDARLPEATRSITINITALDENGVLDPTFNRDVQVYSQFLGTLTPALDAAPLATFHVTNGVATNQTVMLPSVFGATTLWIDDGKDADPTFATGTSPTLWFRDPFIADLQTPKSETALDALSSIPLNNKQIRVDDSRYGTRGRLVVTSVFSQGFTVSDVKCADDAGTPPCVAAAYDHALVFSFSAPRDQCGRPIVEGQVIAGFAGGIAEFNGLTEIGFPQSFAVEDCTHDVAAPNTAREPTPAIVDPNTWFKPLSDASGGLINFERNEASPISVVNGLVCPLDADYTTYKQWKIAPGGDCSATRSLINVITAGTVTSVDPSTLVGMTLPKVTGVLRPVSIGTFNVWIIYPRSAADLVLQ